jgi:hypothetical protein
VICYRPHPKFHFLQSYQNNDPYKVSTTSLRILLDEYISVQVEPFNNTDRLMQFAQADVQFIIHWQSRSLILSFLQGELGPASVNMIK